ncbi:hypothetical protein FKM82_031078 [Ascaphus truei]
MSGKGKKSTNQGVSKYFSPQQRRMEEPAEKQDGGGPRGPPAATSARKHTEETPASGMPVTREYMEALFAEMHTKLHQSLQIDLKEAVRGIREEISTLTKRTTDTEAKVEDTWTKQAAAEEEITRLGEEIAALKENQEEQENRDRRQNIRVRNVPETIAPSQVKAYIMELFALICGDIPEKDLEIDRAHRALGPKSDDPKRRRDIIVRLHSYSSKERILAASREMESLTFQEESIQLYSDLSRQTVIRRQELKPLTSFLREKEVKYRWGFPFKLTVNKGGRFFTIRHPEDMLPFAQALGLTPPPSWLEVHPARGRKEDRSGPARASERIAALQQNVPRNK